MTNELIIDETNFEKYFFDVRKHPPKKGQVVACYEAIAELIDGNLKRDIIYLLLNTEKGGEVAPRLLQNIGGAEYKDSIRIVKEILSDLLAGSSTEEVLKKPYEYTFRQMFYTNREYIPENDPHWWSMSLIDMRQVEGDDDLAAKLFPDAEKETDT